jgi:hypothetical protein
MKVQINNGNKSLRFYQSGHPKIFEEYNLDRIRTSFVHHDPAPWLSHNLSRGKLWLSNRIERFCPFEHSALE